MFPGDSLSGKTNRTEYFFRTMRSSDLDLVVANEKLGYEHPWTKRIFIDCLRAGYQCWVLANNNEIVAHGVLSVAVEECHLLTLCVNPSHQQHGYGRRLFRLLLERAFKEGALVCFLEVRRSNAAALALYKSSGFVQIGERKGYYPGASGREDALILSRDLPLP